MRLSGFIIYILVVIVNNSMNHLRAPRLTTYDASGTNITASTQAPLRVDVKGEYSYTVNNTYTMWSITYGRGENEDYTKVSDIDDVEYGLKTYLRQQGIKNYTYYLNSRKPTNISDLNSYTFVVNGNLEIEVLYISDLRLWRVNERESITEKERLLFGRPINDFSPEEVEFYEDILRSNKVKGSITTIREYNCCYYVFYSDSADIKYLKYDKEDGAVTDYGVVIDLTLSSMKGEK